MMFFLKGIVGNFFHDPETNVFANFLFGDNSHDIQWWNASEPVWMTASNQVRTRNLSFIIKNKIFLKY